MAAEFLKIRILSAICILSAVVFGQTGSSLTNPSVRNTVDGGTLPVTAYRSGLVTSPNPLGQNGNLIVTGNVGGSKHFRGVVPYNAISDFGGSLGSGTLDDFLRRSTIPQNYYSGGVTPFYSQTGTVTRVVGGTNMVVVPPSSKIRTQGFDSRIQKQILYDQGRSEIASRPGSLDMERVRLQPMGTDEPGPYLSPGEQDQAEKERLRDEYHREKKKFTEDLTGLREDITELKQKLSGQSGPSKPLMESGLDRTYAEPLETTNQPQEPLETTNQPQEPLSPTSLQLRQTERVDIYDKMLQEYREAQEAREKLLPEPEKAEEQAKSEQAIPGMELSDRKLEYKQQGRSTPAESKTSQPEEKKPASELEILARSRSALSERQTFAVYSQDKFNRYMQTAEQYMQQGKYYLAVDSYSLASVYKPDDPLAYAGKSHALFAAGEYLSSAFYLSCAIEMFPGYVDFKIGIVRMIGDMDTVEKRITDINAWIELNPAPELNFLLAYVYMELDRLDKASEAVNAAYTKMSDVPAVGLLKAAIDKRRNQ